MAASRTHTDFSMLGSLGAATTCGGMAGQQRRARRGPSGAPTREDLLDAALAANAASVPGGMARATGSSGAEDDATWIGGASITFVTLSDIARIGLS